MATEEEYNRAMFGYIPKNRTSTQRIGFIRIRNLIEAVLVVAPVIALIWFIPFTLTVRMVLSVSLGGLLSFFFIAGVRSKSVFEALVAHRKNKAGIKNLGFPERFTVSEKEEKEKVSIVDKVSNYIDDDNLTESAVRNDTKKKIVKDTKTFVTDFVNALRG